MTRSTVRTMCTVAAATTIAALLGGPGVAAASSGTSGTVRSGTEHFYLMTTLPDASSFEVIAAGLFAAHGIDVAGDTADTVKLPGGTFKVYHGGAVRVVKQQVNPKTCFGLFEATGKITLGGGTGTYAHITGSGSAVIDDVAIAPRGAKGACNLNATPVANEESITATAGVKL